MQKIVTGGTKDRVTKEISLKKKRQPKTYYFHVIYSPYSVRSMRAGTLSVLVKIQSPAFSLSPCTLYVLNKYLPIA